MCSFLMYYDSNVFSFISEPEENEKKTETEK